MPDANQFLSKLSFLSTLADCSVDQTLAYVLSSSTAISTCASIGASHMLWLVLQEEKQGKRKGHDSPEGRRHKRPYQGPSHAMDWGHLPAAPPAYDSPQHMQRAYLPPRAVRASPLGRPPGKSNKSGSSPHKVSQPGLSSPKPPPPPLPLVITSSFFVLRKVVASSIAYVRCVLALSNLSDDL